MAIISDVGLIKDFTIDGSKNNTFPKLPMKQQNPGTHGTIEESYKYFGVYHNKSLHYLSCNVDAYVTKHIIDEGSKSHRKIPNSKIPNMHAGSHNVQGIRVGKYFWIMGGTRDGFIDKLEVMKFQYETSIWLIDREIWIKGPELPSNTEYSMFCGTAINSTFVMFFGMDSIMEFVISYDFTTNIWRKVFFPLWSSSLVNNKYIFPHLNNIFTPVFCDYLDM